MELCDAQNRKDLETIYAENQLENLEDKISFLKSVMKIRATRSDVQDSDEDSLLSLEELALSHMWEGLQA